MKSTIMLSVLALAACEPELDLEHGGPEVDVFDDGAPSTSSGARTRRCWGATPPSPTNE